MMIVTLVLMGVLGASLRHRTLEMGERKEAVDNCRQIIIGLRLFSCDNGNNYPYGAFDSHSSHYDIDQRYPNANRVFRELFKSEVFTGKDERIFGCPHSPFRPDGDVGTTPDYRDAVSEGENHWAMMDGLSDTAPGELPVIFENPADSSIPPRWDTTLAGQSKPGRCWPHHRIVVGFNDGAIRWMDLEAGPGLRKLKQVNWTREISGGKEVFPQTYMNYPLSILQVDQ